MPILRFTISGPIWCGSDYVFLSDILSHGYAFKNFFWDLFFGNFKNIIVMDIMDNIDNQIVNRINSDTE